MFSASSSHRFFWCCPTVSSENFGALIRVLKSARASGVFKADSQNSYVYAEVITRTLNGLLLAGLRRRCREGTISMMAQAFDGGFETRSSIWGTLVLRTSTPTT